MAEAMDQKALWNGAAGRGWVAAQDLVDRAYAPLQQVVVDAVAALAPATVLDVGCGTGGLAVAIAERTGATATGVDVSQPMVDAATARAAASTASASFLVADAGTHDLGTATFDVVTSRFGVMFFDDPTAAFAHLRAATVPRGALRALVFRDSSENAFFTVAPQAVTASGLIELPPNVPGAGGQFAFADPEHVRLILEAAGWTDVAIEPVDVDCTMPEADLAPYLVNLGPLGRALVDADDDTVSTVLAAVLPAFDPYRSERDDQVRFTAACWLLSATA